MKRLTRLLSRAVPALLSLALLAVALRSADLGRAVALVKSQGWRLPFLLLPNLVAILAETSGWWLSLERLGPRPAYRSLLAVRLMCDALLLGLPSGSVVSESLAPYLLKRQCGIPFAQGVVATVARKFFVVVSHGTFLTLATILAWTLLERTSRAAIGRGGLPWLLVATAAILVLTATGGILAGVHGRVADRIHGFLGRLGGRWLGPWLERHAPHFQRTDEHLARFFLTRPLGLAPTVLLYVVGWLVRSGETFLYLKLLGAPIPFAAAMVMETSLILVRALAVPVPGGLGVQDAGYVLCLKALGVPEAATVGTAFVILKRGKDLFWISLGFVLLAISRRSGAGPIAVSDGPAQG
jgi:uncharacterized protein (TIRG00374 family)